MQWFKQNKLTFLSTTLCISQVPVPLTSVRFSHEVCFHSPSPLAREDDLLPLTSMAYLAGLSRDFFKINSAVPAKQATQITNRAIRKVGLEPRVKQK